MIRYLSADITFQEVPGEVSLVFFITGCPRRCPGCHSPELQQEVGEELTADALRAYSDKYRGMFTCICFMGDGGDYQSLAHLLLEAKLSGLKVALYTGDDDPPGYIWQLVDYLKTGPYIEARGGLASPDTNQVFYRIQRYTCADDWTRKFRPTLA